MSGCANPLVRLGLGGSSNRTDSNDTDQIALWMIDTAYNEESFFVRQCYFTGGQDPFIRLKRALKADIDEELDRHQRERLFELFSARTRELPYSDFAEMLRSAMREDEWLLYLHGAVLGLGAGLLHLAIFG